MTRALKNTQLLIAKFAIDASVITAALVIAYALRFGGEIPDNHLRTMTTVLPFAIGLKLIVLWAMGNYGTLWRYSSVKDLMRLVRSSIASSLAIVVLLYFVLIRLPDLRIPASVLIVDFLLFTIFCGVARLTPRLIREQLKPNVPISLKRLVRLFPRPRIRGGERRILVVGAGDAGETLVREM